MLLTDARRPARLDSRGCPVSLEDQDRRLWHGDLIEEGRRLLQRALDQGPVGAYAIQAAIADLHDEAASVASTDWPQIVALYDALLAISDSPLVRLNRAVAVAMRDGPDAGLAALADLDQAPQLKGTHLLPAARADLLSRLGRHGEAAAAYRDAIAQAGNAADRAYLTARLEALDA